MFVLAVLFGFTLVFRALGLAGVALFDTWLLSARAALAVMFSFTAASHFGPMKKDLIAMVPPSFPRPDFACDGDGTGGVCWRCRADDTGDPNVGGFGTDSAARRHAPRKHQRRTAWGPPERSSGDRALAAHTDATAVRVLGLGDPIAAGDSDTIPEPAERVRIFTRQSSQPDRSRRATNRMCRVVMITDTQSVQGCAAGVKRILGARTKQAESDVGPLFEQGHVACH